MNFDLDQDGGEWFNFFDSHIDASTGEIVCHDPVPDARVQIRNPTPFLMELLSKRKRKTEYVHNPKSRSMERLSFNDELTFAELKAEREDVWDYAITGFENFKDSKTGQEIACTRENKIKLMQNPVFDRFIARCLDRIAGKE